MIFAASFKIIGDMKKFWTAGGMIAAMQCISLIVFTSCSDNSAKPGRESVMYVRTDTVSVSENINTLEYSGIIDGKSTVALSFSSIGTIESLNVSEGDYVAKGRLVATLDPTSARSVYDAAGSSLKQAQDAYDRLKSVHDKGSLPDIQMVDIETKLDQAKSAYNIAKKNLDYCSLYAPISGVVGRKLAEAGENVVPGKTIITLIDISSVKINFSVPENEINLIPSSCESIITVSALGDRQFSAKQIEKNLVANPVSHTYTGSVTIQNASKELLPGMICRVELQGATKEPGITVPLRVVMVSADGKKFVWCVENGSAKRRLIETGGLKGDNVEVRKGLSAGDVIISEGMQKISEGDKIAVR